MKNKTEKLLILIILITISLIIFHKDKLYDAVYEEPKDSFLAITINGDISTTFPTSKYYETSVSCTSGTGKVEWNGSKWVLMTSGITKGSTKCNATFSPLNFKGTILANNQVKNPVTTPGIEVNGHTLDDITYTSNASLATKYRSYYYTYGTGWTANGTGFNLTGATVSGTYTNSYSTLVGKYLPAVSEHFNKNDFSSSSYSMKTTTNLNSVYYVVSATSTGFKYKKLTSNKNVTEAELASTTDDYGTSYYFRGAVKNNYVQFANKCWRIVRINGNDSVKIVLHNDNTSNVTNPCAAANNNPEAAFAHYDGSTYESTFNSNNTDNTYMGFMYGTAGASSYASAHANTNKSEALTNLETWYKNNMTSYTNKLADTIWCNDKSMTSGNLGYGTNSTNYGAYNRLITSKTPSLKCPNDSNGGKLSKFTVSDTTNGNGALTYKVGLLTADELVFSGLAPDKYNITTYLQENSTDRSWVSLSPYIYDSDGAFIWFVSSSGDFTGGGVYNSVGLRPAVSLVSSTMVTGSGTSSDPYIVK